MRHLVAVTGPAPANGERATTTINLPASWYQYSELDGPPIGSTVQLTNGQEPPIPCTVTGHRPHPVDPSLIQVDLQLPAGAVLPGWGEPLVSIAGP